MRDSSNAARLQRILREKNFSAYSLKFKSLSGDYIFRVRVGPYLDRLAAQRDLEKIKDLGYSDSYIVDHRGELAAAADSSRFTSAKPGNTQENRKRLTENWRCRNPQWSPTGREIAFYAEDSPDGAGLFTIGSGGGLASQIISSRDSVQVTPRFLWTPDGQSIICVVKALNKSFEYTENLCKVSKDGGRVRTLLAQEHFPFHISELKLSPDGQKIAFTAKYDSDRQSLYGFESGMVLRIPKARDRSTSAGAKLTELSRFDESTRIVGWRSKDEILFLVNSASRAGLSPGNHQEVWSYDMRTMKRTRLAGAPPLPNCVRCDLLPGGREIIYLTAPASGSGAGLSQQRIVAINLNEGTKTILYEIPGDDSRVPDYRYAKNGEIFIPVRNTLWVYTGEDRKTIVPLESPFQDFTLSPKARKICILDGGALYRQALSF